MEEVYEELRGKHSGKFTPEQIRMWAQLIHMGKQKSTDDPLDKPFWCGCKRADPIDSSQ